MHEHNPHQAVAQMPPVAGPEPLERAALDQLAEDGINAVMQ